jgi:paraquat-inducible protein B
LTDARRPAQNLNNRIGPLADDLDGTLRDARKMVNNVDGQIGPLAGNLDKTVEKFGKLARDTDARLGAVTENLDRTLSSARGAISDDAPLIVELENTLREIFPAARSIRQLANTLDQKPEVLIQGLGKSGEK